MSIQHIFNKEALDMMPICLAYRNSVSIERAGHHNAVILQHISNSTKPIAQMSKDELEKFDNTVCNRLKELDIIR